MEKVERIVRSIQELKENEIDSFIEKRISELANSEEREIGFNTDTYMYNGFLDEKIRVNFGGIIGESEGCEMVMFSSMRFNDPDMFKPLIHELRSREYTLGTPYVSVIGATDSYLFLKDENRRDNSEYYTDVKTSIAVLSAVSEKTYPIQVYKSLGIGTCTQIAGVNQNMFKFLGIDSDYAIGMCGECHHAFNIVYPWGREEDAILFDSMRPVGSDPYLYLLDEDKKRKLFSNEVLTLKRADVKKAYKKLFDIDPECDIDEIDHYVLIDGDYFDKPVPDLMPTSTRHTLVFRRVDDLEDEEEKK
jgi:hypothetical protein